MKSMTNHNNDHENQHDNNDDDNDDSNHEHWQSSLFAVAVVIVGVFAVCD